MMSSRASLWEASKHMASPRSSAVKRRRTEEEVAPVAAEKEDSALIGDEGEECPVAMGTPDPSYVLSIYERRNYNIPSVDEDDTLFCRILNRRVDPSRLADRHWCSCGNCILFSQPRENLCCQEVIRVASSPFTVVVERIREKMGSMDGFCITGHPSFRKVVLDQEVLSLLLENGRFEARDKRGASEKIEENRHITFGSCLAFILVKLFRRYRYYAYRSFVLWAYGHLGLGNRLEIPACVRSAIMRMFPSQVKYVGFRSSGFDNSPVEADDSCWYGDAF